MNLIICVFSLTWGCAIAVCGRCCIFVFFVLSSFSYVPDRCFHSILTCQHQGEHLLSWILLEQRNIDMRKYNNLCFTQLNKSDLIIIIIYFYILYLFNKFLFVDCPLGYHSINCSESCRFPSFGKDCQGTCKCNPLFCDHVLGCLRYTFNGTLLFDFCIMLFW